MVAKYLFFLAIFNAWMDHETTFLMASEKIILGKEKR